jgi:hypothetical protein
MRTSKTGAAFDVAIGVDAAAVARAQQSARQRPPRVVVRRGPLRLTPPQFPDRHAALIPPVPMRGARAHDRSPGISVASSTVSNRPDHDRRGRWS